MNSIIASIRPLFEILYFASGIALTLGLWITYGQLKSIRRDSIERSERASKEKAIEAANSFMGKAIPKINAAYDARKDAGITDKFKGKGPNFLFDAVSDGSFLTADEYQPAIKLCLDACNEMESVASYFISRVADERTGFDIFGRGFCASVESNYKIISVGRLYQTDPSYQSIAKLYNLWSPRIESGELTKKIKDLQDRAARIGKSNQKPSSLKK